MQKEFIDFILKNILTNPEAIEVNKSEEFDSITIDIKVDPIDIPKVIGKNGVIIKAIENLTSILTMNKENYTKKITLSINK